MSAPVSTEYYSPREIVRNKWILNSFNTPGESSYKFVLRLISRGGLIAKSMSEQDAKKPHLLVRGSEIIKYIKKYGEVTSS